MIMGSLGQIAPKTTHDHGLHPECLGSLGLILVAVGAVVHSTAAEAAGVVILIITLLVVGVALIAVQVYGDLREHHRAQGRHRHSPSR